MPACNAHLLTFCSCAHCWQDIARSFNSLGIIDVRKDESICDAFGAFVTVLFGAFDAALVCSFESFLNIFIMLRWRWRGSGTL